MSADVNHLEYTNEKDARSRIEDELNEAKQILLKFKNKF
jgi:hypothetical protein